MNINKMIGGLDPNTRARSSSVDAQSSLKTNTAASENHSDQVNLSHSGRNIQQIEAEIKAMPEVDDSTVERIRNAIANGDYKIDYEKLAGKMLNFEDILK